MHENEMSFKEDPGLRQSEMPYGHANVDRVFLGPRGTTAERYLKSGQCPEYHRGSQNSIVVKSCRLWNQSAWA